MIESTMLNEKQDFEAQFAEFFKSFQEGHSAEEISRKKNLPLTIVEIKLKKACRRGVLALDSRIEGTKFYKNLLMAI